MLQSDYLDVLPDPIVYLYEKYMQSVINDIARQLAGMNYASDTAAWQMQRLTESGRLYESILSELEILTGKTKTELRAMFKEAGVKAIAFDDGIYKAAGLNPLPLNLSPAMAQVLEAGLRKTQNVMQNLTLTTAIAGQDMFINAADLAYMQVSSGAFDYISAIRQAVKEVADQGLQVIHYASGRRDQLDVAMRRTVLTGVSQTVGNLQLARADEMGCDLVAVSAHVGARNKGVGPANHESWQGKIYSISSRDTEYPNFVEVTGYGTAVGLMGINCRHSFYPFFEGISDNAYSQAELDSYSNKTVTYNGKEMSMYDATQYQRGIERKIRYWKRQAGALEAAGQDNTLERLKMGEWQTCMRDFVKQTKLIRQSEREQVQGVSLRALTKKPVEVPAFIKSYPGVTIDVGGNQTIEKVIESSLDELQKQGYDFPKTIKTDFQFFVKHQAEKDSPCAYLKNVLYINDRHEMWENPFQYMEESYLQNFLSTNKPESAIWHEVAHFLHQKADPVTYNRYILGGFSDIGDKTIAKLVSRYAADSAIEFVAEVFAARMAGMDKNFPLEVFALFQKYGGGI